MSDCLTSRQFEGIYDRITNHNLIDICRAIFKGEDVHFSVVLKPLPFDDQLLSADVSIKFYVGIYFIRML